MSHHSRTQALRHSRNSGTHSHSFSITLYCLALIIRTTPNGNNSFRNHISFLRLSIDTTTLAHLRQLVQSFLGPHTPLQPCPLLHNVPAGPRASPLSPSWPPRPTRHASLLQAQRFAPATRPTVSIPAKLAGLPPAVSQCSPLQTLLVLMHPPTTPLDSSPRLTALDTMPPSTWPTRTLSCALCWSRSQPAQTLTRLLICAHPHAHFMRPV